MPSLCGDGMSGLFDGPDGKRWIDVLHWSVRVMNVDDPDLAFVSSLLSYSIKNNGLTDKQVKYADRTLIRLMALRDLGELPGQLRDRAIDIDAQNGTQDDGTVH